MSSAEQEIERIYEQDDGDPTVEDFHLRHEIESLCILTITSAYAATREVDQFANRIRGKVVIEIGAGVGFLALEMARFAKQVYAIEADPAWSWVFTKCLYSTKPPNLTYIFGTAESMIGKINGDVAVVYTRSATEHMVEIAKKFCPEVIRGPVLSIEEREPDASPEIIELAKRIADTVTAKDWKSRRSFVSGGAAL